MTIKIISFSYRLGVPAIVQHAWDMRELRNPYHNPKLKNLTGLHQEVQEYVAMSPGYISKEQAAVAMARDGAVLGFGCIGGKHRSVAAAELVKGILMAEGKTVEVEHWGLNSEFYLQQARQSVTL